LQDDPKATYSAYGLEWIDNFFRINFPEIIMRPPSEVFLFYFVEFDRWRLSYKLRELQSYQGVLINSRTHDAKFVPKKIRKNIINWYGKTYSGNFVGLLCFDLALVASSAASIPFLLSHVPPNEIFSQWALCVSDSKPDDELLASISLLSSDERGSIVSARSHFREAVEIILKSGIRSENDLALRSYAVSEQDHRHFFNVVSNNFESMTTHFLLGHEFGHYCFNIFDNIFTKSIHLFLQDIIETDLHLSNTLIQEIFCDIVGMENCLFQCFEHKLPILYAIYAPLWSLMLLSTSLPESKLDIRMRQDILCRFWAKRRPYGKTPVLSEIASKARDDLDPLGALMGERIVRLNPQFRYPYS
jgi:hypothetical protein